MGENIRFLIRTTAATMLLRFLSIPLTWLTLRQTIHDLSPHDFGLFQFAFSMTAVIGLSDFGITSAVVNRVGAEVGKRGDEVEQIFKTAFFLTAALSSVVLVVVLFACWLVVSHQARNVLPTPINFANGIGISLFGILFIISLPLGVAKSVMLAHRRGAEVDAGQGVGALFAYIVFVILFSRYPRFEVAMMAAALPTLLGNLMNCFQLHDVIRRSLRHPLRSDLSRELMRDGSSFTLTSVAAALLAAGSNTFLAGMAGLAGYGEFSMFVRVSTTLASMLNPMVAPIWILSGDAQRSGRGVVRGNSLLLIVIIALLACVIVGVICARVAPPVLQFALGRTLDVSYSALSALFIWNLVTNASYLLGALALGFNILRFRALNSIMVTAVVLFGQYCGYRNESLTQFYWFSILGFVLVYVLPHLIVLTRKGAGASAV